MKLNTLTIPAIDFNAFNRPADGLAEGLPKHCHAGLAYGRQTFKCPLTRTALPQLTHKDAVRQEDHIHVASLSTDPDRLAVLGLDLAGQFLCLEFLATKDDLTIEFQVSHVATFMSVDVIEVLGVGKPIIEGKITRDILLHHPVNQFSKEFIMITESDISFLTVFFLDEATELKRIMLAGGADIIDDDIIMSDFAAALCVVPEVSDILNKFAAVVDQNVINGDNCLLTVASRRLFLQPVKAFLVELLDVPISFGDPAVQTGLVGSSGKFAVDSRYIFAIGYKQAGEIFCEMNSFWLVSEQVAELFESFFDDIWELHDSGHNSILPAFVICPTVDICRQNSHLEFNSSILQKFSTNENRFISDCICRKFSHFAEVLPYDIGPPFDFPDIPRGPLPPRLPRYEPPFMPEPLPSPLPPHIPLLRPPIVPLLLPPDISP